MLWIRIWRGQLNPDPAGSRYATLPNSISKSGFEFKWIHSQSQVAHQTAPPLGKILRTPLVVLYDFSWLKITRHSAVDGPKWKTTQAVQQQKELARQQARINKILLTGMCIQICKDPDPGVLIKGMFQKKKLFIHDIYLFFVF